MASLLTGFIDDFEVEDSVNAVPPPRDYSGVLELFDQSEQAQRDRRLEAVFGAESTLNQLSEKQEEIDDDIGFFGHVGDFFTNIPEGFQQEVNDIADFFELETIDPETGEKSEPRFEIEEPESVGGAIGFGLGQLSTFAVPATGVLKLARAPKLIKGMLTTAGVGAEKASMLGAILTVEGGAIVGSQLAFAAEDPTIANLIQQYPALQNPLTEFLATDPTESSNVNRFKQALTDVGLAGLLTPIFSVVGRGLAKFKGTRQAAQEITGVGDSDRTKQFLFEEYLRGKGLPNSEAIGDTRRALDNGTIDEVVEQSTGRPAADVYAEMRADASARQRVLARQVFEAQEIDPSVAAHNTAKLQDEGRLDEMIEAATGQNTQQWDRMAAPEKAREVTDPSQSAFISKPQRVVSEIFRPNMIMDQISRVMKGFGANPAELKRAFDNGTMRVKDLAKSFAVMADQISNKTMTRVHAFMDEGFHAVPVLPSRHSVDTATPLAFGGKSLGNIFADGKFVPAEVDEFLTYVQTERAMILQNLDEPIPNILQFKEESTGVLERGRANPKFQDALADYSVTVQGVLRYAQRSGLLSPSDVSNIIKSSKRVDGQYFYAPLYVDPDGSAFKSARASGNSFKSLQGNLDVELQSPLESLTQYISSVIHRSEVNNLKVAFYDDVDRWANSLDEATRAMGAKAARKVDTAALKGNSELNSALKAQVSKLIKEAAEKGDGVMTNSSLAEIATEDLSKMSLDGLLKLAPAVRQMEAGGKFYDVVFRKGKAELYEINDPVLREYFETLGAPTVFSLNNSNSIISQALSAPLRGARRTSKLYGSFVTQFPVFQAVNFLRDTVSATANSAFAFVPLLSSVKGLKTSFANKELYREMLLAGATGATRGETVPRLLTDIDRLSKKAGVSAVTRDLQTNVVKKWFTKGLDKYSEFITHMEMAARVAEYQMARKHGMSPELSALFANEVSVNFMKRGTNKTLNTFADMTPFFNAGLQGSHKLMRTIRHQPAKLGGVVAGYAAYTFMMDDYSRQFKEYAGIDEDTKSMYTTIPIFADMGQAAEDIANGVLPELDAETPFFLWPNPYDIGFVSTALSASVRDAFSDDARDSMTKALGRMINNMVPMAGTPTVLSPIIDKATNTDHFGNEIVPDYYDVDHNMERMYRPSTNSLAIRLSEGSKWLNGMFREGEGEAFIHPLMADHFINFVTPGFLGAANNAADILTRDSDAGELPGTLPGGPSKSARPEVFALEKLTGRFLLGTSELRAGTQILFDLKDAAHDIRTSEKNLLKQVTEEVFEKTVTAVDGEERKIKDIYPAIDRMATQMGWYTQRKQVISSNRTINGEEKAAEIAELEGRKQKELLRFLAWLEVMDPERDLRRVTKQGSTKPLLFGKE